MPGVFPVLRGRSVRVTLHLAAVLAIIASITFLCSRVVLVNALSVGFAYLVAILVIATVWGLLEAAVASVAAALCLNYFFLPPIGTLTIADPENWIALFAFLLTAIIASELSARAKQRTREALDRQQDTERLYALSRAILLTEANRTAPKQIANQIAQIFDFPAVSLYDRDTGDIHRAGPEDLRAIDDELHEAAVQGTLFHDEVGQTTVTSIRLGGQPIGSLAIRGSSLSDGALQALSNLVAIALEKVRGQEVASRAEAARQSEELKSTLLDAIAHEFKTPLTSIKAAASALLSGTVSKTEEQRELTTIVNEEADRLGRLVTEAIQMARLEAGKIQLNRSMHSVEGLISAVLQQMTPVTEGRRLEVGIASDLPMIEVDPELMQLAIRHLLDNALKYSSPESPLRISAATGERGLMIKVSDKGPGILERDQARIFEKFYRGPNTHSRVPGTGMGLAIAREIVRAHGGDIWVESSAGQGAEFCIAVPVTAREETA
jgi:two-component system sensor histidine kinase KdpD